MEGWWGYEHCLVWTVYFYIPLTSLLCLLSPKEREEKRVSWLFSLLSPLSSGEGIKGRGQALTPFPANAGKNHFFSIIPFIS
jgi:hypothetical protein